MSDRGLTIGRLAKDSGVNRETIRYYEKRGLLDRARRTLAGYRIYSSEAFRRVRFIKQTQALGFSLSEIAELMSLEVDPNCGCADVRDTVDKKIDEIEARITALKAMKQALSTIAEPCPAKGPTANCPIFDALYEATKEVECQ